MANAQQEKPYWAPPIFYDPKKKGPLHRTHTTKPYYEPKSLKRDLKAHDAPKENWAFYAREAAKKAATFNEAAKPGQYKLPKYFTNAADLKSVIRGTKKHRGAISELEKALATVKHQPVGLHKYESLPQYRQLEEIAKAVYRTLAEAVPSAIASQQRHPEIETPSRQSLYPIEHAKRSRAGRGAHGYQYRHGHNYQLAAAVIGITILLLLGTSLLTGQISGAAVVADLENSPDFPFSLLIFLLVVFLFGMMWRSSKYSVS